MSTVICHSCEKTFDRSEMRWFQPFADVIPQGQQMDTVAAVTTEPMPGSVALCPSCLTDRTGGQPPL